MQKQKINIHFDTRSSTGKNGGCAICGNSASLIYTVEENQNTYCLCDNEHCFAHFELNERFIVHGPLKRRARNLKQEKIQERGVNPICVLT